jgi:uncharacterized membrane protein YecN with MAPEG domain
MTHITSFYAAVFGMFFISISLRTIKLRRKHKVALGTGGEPELERAIRVHANFIEYTPITLLLIYMLESMNTSSILIHALCIGLLIGRSLHAFGVSQVNENLNLRVGGMLLTFGTLGIASISLIIASLLNHSG